MTRSVVIKAKLRLNEDITWDQVRLITDGGEQLGIMSSAEALALAGERGLDLVEVAPDAKPPVCRLQDFDKLRYERKRQREKSRKLSKRQEVKELRLTPNTSKNDVNVKANQARKFLEAGDKVKLIVKFVGREITHPELGFEIVRHIVEATKDIGELESEEKFEGKRLVSILQPLANKAGEKPSVE